MEKEEEKDRRMSGKTILKNGQGWILPAQLGRLKTGQYGKGFLRGHLWCPNDLACLWDRLLIEAPSYFILGRPKAALLFWFLGGFRCGVWLSFVILVRCKKKKKKKRKKKKKKKNELG